MRTLLLLALFIFSTASVYAEQALVLTEIEQIQEKIWYLQRDLAAQKDSLEKTRGQLVDVTSRAEKTHTNLSGQLDTLTRSVDSHVAATTQIESKLQQLHETLFELNDKAAQQEDTSLGLTTKVAALEGSLKALRSELAAQQTRHEKALTETRTQLGEVLTKLELLKQDTTSFNNQVWLWVAGAVLVAAVLLTIVIVLKGSRGKSRRKKHREPSQHEL